MSRRRTPTFSTEYALLGFLHDKPLHGYELHQRLQEAQTLGLVWRVKQAHLYALLAKLEADGLIQAELVAQDARPPKRLLHITEAGRITFMTWRTTPVGHGRDLRIEFLAKLFWAQQHSLDDVNRLLAAQREITETLLSTVRDELTASAAEEPYIRLVHQFRRGQLEAMLEWLDTCESTLVPVMA